MFRSDALPKWGRALPFLAALMIAGCDDELSTASLDDAELARHHGEWASAWTVATARLVGEEETTPVDTDAHGRVILREARDGLAYRLVVVRLDDAVAAHIHCGPEGANGPVGVTLFSGGPVSANGVLASGTITAPDPANTCGWEDLDDVIEAIGAGDTYVNVHTVLWPGGEIRGQL